MTLPPSKQLDQFVVRLPDGMRDRIKAAAEVNNRSMNAEIVATLEEKYPQPIDPASVRFAAAFEMINEVRNAESDEKASQIMHQLNVALAIAQSPLRVTYGSPMRDAYNKRNVITVDSEEPW